MHFLWVTSNVTLSMRYEVSSESTGGFFKTSTLTSNDIPFLNCQAPFFPTKFVFFVSGSMLKGGFYEKIPRVAMLQQEFQPPGATTLGCLVVFCDCLCPTSREHWTSTRAIEVQRGKKHSTASTTVSRVWVGSCCVFLISGVWKRVLPVLPRAYSEWHLLNDLTLPMVFVMLVPSFALSSP